MIVELSSGHIIIIATGTIPMTDYAGDAENELHQSQLIETQEYQTALLILRQEIQLLKEKTH